MQFSFKKNWVKHQYLAMVTALGALMEKLYDNWENKLHFLLGMFVSPGSLLCIIVYIIHVQFNVLLRAGKEIGGILI